MKIKTKPMKAIKCRIHIALPNGRYMDDRLFIEITLPCLPSEGDTLCLREKSQKQLESKIESSPELTEVFNWDSKRDELIDFVNVHSICFTPNVDYVDIELSDRFTPERFQDLEDRLLEKLT